MKIIFFLIAISLLIAAGFLTAFFWAVGSGQYDDDYTPSLRVLVDDDMITKKQQHKITNKKQQIKSTKNVEN